MYKEILETLHKRASADFETASTNLKIYLNNPVGIGEHPTVVEEADKLLTAMADAQGKKQLLESIVAEVNANEEAKS